MRIVFTIEVGVDVPSYVQAGEILDQVTRQLKETIGEKGEFDVRNFLSHHTPIRKYPEDMMAMAEGSNEAAYTEEIRRH